MLAIASYILLGLLIAAGLTLIGFAISWVVYVPLAARCCVQLPFLRAEPSQPMAGGEKCEFQTGDGLTLRGDYLPTTASERAGVLMFCHELTGDRWGATRYLAPLRAAGFDLFTFDFRNHGASDRVPDYQPGPWITPYEVDDVLSALDYLATRADSDPRGVGIMGISKGAGAALCAAAHDARVRAVVTDGAFTLETMMTHYLRRFMDIYTFLSPVFSRLPDAVLAQFGKSVQRQVARQQGHKKYVDVSQVIRRVRKPVLLIHGQRDNFVPVEIGRTLWRSLGLRGKLWVVEGAKHNASVHVASDKYHRRLRRFFLNVFPAALPARRNVAAMEQAA